jgi:P4 family phage/plasmid primase-like protien
MADLNKNTKYDSSNNLYTFLSTRYIKENYLVTHLKLGNPGGKYYIAPNDMPKFYKLYANEMGKSELRLVEKPMDVSPLLIDIDYDTVHKHRVYTSADVLLLSKMCKQILSKIFIVSQKTFKVFILEKPGPSIKKEGVYKDGFHVIFPSIGINTNMRYYVLGKLRSKLEAAKMFKKEKTGMNNDYHKIVDLSIVKNNGITMVGSSKPGGQMYKVTTIYNNTWELDKIDIYTNEDLLNILSNRKFTDETMFAKINSTFSRDEYVAINKKMEKQYGSGKISPNRTAARGNETDSDSDSDDDKDTPILPGLHGNSGDNVNDDESDEDSQSESEYPDNTDVDSDSDFDVQVETVRKQKYDTDSDNYYKDNKKKKTIEKKKPSVGGDFTSDDDNSEDDKAKKKSQSNLKKKKGNETDSDDDKKKKKKKGNETDSDDDKKKKKKKGNETDSDDDKKKKKKKGNETDSDDDKKKKKKKGNETDSDDDKKKKKKKGNETDSDSDYDSDSNSDSDDDPKANKRKRLERIERNKKVVKGAREKFDYVSNDNKRLYQKVKEERLTGKEKEIELARSLSKILSKKRATDYYGWIHTGWALFNVSEELYGAFKAFSKKCNGKYDESKCQEIWNRARKGGFGMPSLHKWAKEDNKEQYMNIIRETMDELFVIAEEGCDYDLAKLVFELYKYKYKCVSLKHNAWYEFKDHRWEEIDNGCSLNIRISEGVVSEFALLSSQYLKKCDTERGHVQRDVAIKKSSDIMKLTKKLRSDSFKSSIMNQCKILFLDKKFEEKLDANKDLIAFDNGVYDLKNEYFRDGVQDDYITFSVGYKYQEYSYEHKYVKEVLNYFSSIQKDVKMRDYLIVLLSSYISGHNKDQQFIIWTGTGSNGKSKTLEFCKLAWGNYAGTLPIKILTGKRANAGVANPEIADTKGKRLVVFQEPENDDVIQVGYMKELSGSDPICARKLFRDPFTFIPQFKMILTCNKLPTIPSTDGGTWRRIRVSPFESEFIDVDEKGNNANNGKPLSGKQSPKRFDFEEKMEEWKAAFMWLLIKTYVTKYKNGKIQQFEPEKVKAETKSYEMKSDIVLEFITQLYTVTNDKDDYTRVKDLYESYKEWFKSSHGSTNSRQLTAQEFTKYFRDKDTIYNITSNDRIIRGLRINDDIESEDEDEELDE